jgi:hypothetical protein
MSMIDAVDDNKTMYLTWKTIINLSSYDRGVIVTCR